MNSKHRKFLTCAAAVCGSVCSFAAMSAESEEVVAEEAAPQILSAEARLSFD